MTIDQAKLDRIKASLASDAKATPAWLPRLYIKPADAFLIARAHTTAPAMAKLLLDEILWLEEQMHYKEHHCQIADYVEGLITGHVKAVDMACNRLASIVNGWPEETL